MHADWISYLNTLELSPYIPANKQAILAPLSHLAVLTVSGKDATGFLQGQTTCDIKALIDAKPKLGAFCNAKGRTISTFIIIRQQESFQLILTSDLIDTVRKKLQMYILRSDVLLTDQSDHLCVLGIHNAEPGNQDNLFQYPQLDNSFLFIGPADQARAYTNTCIAEQTHTLVDSAAWLDLDIQAGIPWLFQETTENFVPQMLNLDKLDAISFNKGCYTGQEIVARTHYLGQNKRSMYRADCHSDINIASGCTITDAANPESPM
ncbi:MAG: folate-binding protein, partial [Gammaproteobacteria bacterium]